MMTMMMRMAITMVMITVNDDYSWIQVENYKILDNYSQPLKQSTTGSPFLLSFRIMVLGKHLISNMFSLTFFFFRRNSWICGSPHKGESIVVVIIIVFSRKKNKEGVFIVMSGQFCTLAMFLLLISYLYENVSHSVGPKSGGGERGDILKPDFQHLQHCGASGFAHS